MQPPADVRANGAAERAVEVGALAWLTTAPEDSPSCDARIPSAISLAFRRAVRRVKAEMELTAACDVAAADGGLTLETLESICNAVRQAYVRGGCAPVSGGPLALDVFKRLRRTFVDELDALRESLRPGQLAEALGAVDVVREQIDGDESQRFVTALRSEGALDLVVEVAHDMRSPLTTILMLTDMIRRPQLRRTADAQHRQLDLVYSAAFGLNALVNDVIALARGGDRLIDRDPVPFSTSALMHSVAGMLRPIAEEQKLALRVVTPSVDGRVGQPIALSRVLLNLASNALKYTITGEVSITAVDLHATHVGFEVADTGPGIPADVMPGLFDPFGKRAGGSHGRRFSRTGLGLAICRKLLRDLGSELQFDSAPGQGTRFFFELALPVADEEAVRDAASGGQML